MTKKQYKKLEAEVMKENMKSINLSPEGLKEIRKIAEKATPGLWFDFYDPKENMIENSMAKWVMGLSEVAECPFIQGFPEDIASEMLDHCPAKVDINEEDLKHIAMASPAIVISLINEIEKLRAENEKLKEKINQ